MSFRNKIFLIFLATVLASVSLVAYGVTHYTQRAFEQQEAQHTEALVAQFKKEFDQRGEMVVQQVENITNADTTVRMVLDLARPNADSSIYLHDANGAAQTHNLDFVEFANTDGILISSAQYPARVGYKVDWVTANKNWDGTSAFLKREELPDGVALSLSAVRAYSVGDKIIYTIGGRRLDQNFLADLVLPAGMRALLYRNLENSFVPTALTDASGPVQQADQFQSLIEQAQKQPQQGMLVKTIQWTSDPASAETFHAIPLPGRNGELLGVLLFGSSGKELVVLKRQIFKISALVALAAIAIGLLLAWWVSKRITRPVEELANGARDVASGRWDTHIDVQGDDEIGQLAGAFNNMTHTLATQKEKLVQTERVAAWRELARRLAHELRNPLFPMQITLENLQRARTLGPRSSRKFLPKAPPLSRPNSPISTVSSAASAISPKCPRRNSLASM